MIKILFGTILFEEVPTKKATIVKLEGELSVSEDKVNSTCDTLTDNGRDYVVPSIYTGTIINP